MLTPRRKFLKSGATAALAAGLLAGSRPLGFAQRATGQEQRQNHEVPHQAKTDPVFYFTRGTFEPHVNTEFRVVAGALVTRMMLLDVSNCGPKVAKDGAAGECFVLFFRADSELAKVRTIHTVEHDALSKFSLFFSRSSKKDDPEGIYYEAVINRRQR